MSEYEGPMVQVGRGTYGRPRPKSPRWTPPNVNEGQWQYALRQPDGTYVELDGTPRVAGRNLVRRWMIPATTWETVHDVDL